MNVCSPPSPLFEMALGTIDQQLRTRSEPLAHTSAPPYHSHDQLEDYAHILQGQLPLRPAEVVLVDLIEHSWQGLAALAKAKGLRYSCHGLTQLPARVLADARRLRQIIDNLLRNAIEFTSSGRVELHAHWQPNDPGAGVLYLYVVDTGAGMSSRTKDKLFNPFDHVLTQLERHQRGQGGFSRHLGLVVTAGIVRAWGGQIEVRSALGTGSTFMVELPMTCTQSGTGLFSSGKDSSPSASQPPR